MNYLITVSDKLEFVMNVDDTTIYFNIEDFDQYNTQEDITSELEKITLWLKRNVQIKKIEILL